MLVLFLVVFYIFISYLVYVQLLKTSSFLFFVVSAVYLPSTYYFELFAVRLDNFLIYNNLFVESRHTNYLLVALFFVCIFTVIHAKIYLPRSLVDIKNKEAFMRKNEFGEALDDNGRRFVDTERYLRHDIMMDEQHLAAAPLGPIQRKRLERRIAENKAELKELNRKKREAKKKKEKT